MSKTLEAFKEVLGEAVQTMNERLDAVEEKREQKEIMKAYIESGKMELDDKVSRNELQKSALATILIGEDE